MLWLSSIDSMHGVEIGLCARASDGAELKWSPKEILLLRAAAATQIDQVKLAFGGLQQTFDQLLEVADKAGGGPSAQAPAPRRRLRGKLASPVADAACGSNKPGALQIVLQDDKAQSALQDGAAAPTPSWRQQPGETKQEYLMRRDRERKQDEERKRKRAEAAASLQRLTAEEKKAKKAEMNLQYRREKAKLRKQDPAAMKRWREVNRLQKRRVRERARAMKAAAAAAEKQGSGADSAQKNIGAIADVAQPDEVKE